jgi:hypothetical protein
METAEDEVDRLRALACACGFAVGDRVVQTATGRRAIIVAAPQAASTWFRVYVPEADGRCRRCLGANASWRVGSFELAEETGAATHEA